MKLLRASFAALFMVLCLNPSATHAATDTARSTEISVSKPNVPYGANESASFSVSIAARANTNYGPSADKIYGINVTCGSIWAINIPWTTSKLSNLVSVYNFGKYSHQQAIKRLDSTNGEYVQLAPIALSFESSALAEASQSCEVTAKIDYAVNWSQNSFTIARGDSLVFGEQSFNLQALPITISKALEIKARTNQPDYLEGFFSTPIAGITVRYRWFDGVTALTPFVTYNGFQAGAFEGKTLRLEVEVAKALYSTRYLVADFFVPSTSTPNPQVSPNQPTPLPTPKNSPTAPTPKPTASPTPTPTTSGGTPSTNLLSFGFAKQMVQVTARKSTNLTVRISWIHRIQYSGLAPTYSFKVRYKKASATTYLTVASNLKSTTTSVNLKNLKAGTYNFVVEAVTSEGKVFETSFTSRVK